VTSASDASTPIRDEYEEFLLGDTTVGMIADPDNSDAWIQSDVVQPIAD